MTVLAKKTGLAEKASLAKKTGLAERAEFFLRVLKSQAGFSLIGVLASSSIGLIVIGGITQMFTGMSGQIQQLEQGARRIYLTERIGRGLRGACKQNLNKKRDTTSTSTTEKLSKFVAQGGIGSPLDKIDFYQVVDDKGNNIINLKDKNETARLAAEYGIRDPGDPLASGYPKAHLVFQLLCNQNQPDGSTGANRCKCDGSTQTYPCNKKWTARLVSQSLVQGMPRYDKNFGFEMDVSWTSAPNANYDNFNCSVTNQVNACYTVETLGNKRTLIGCGSTQNLGGSETTAIGYDAGRSANVATGADKNVFIGSKSGQNAAVSGNRNAFLGDHTGDYAEVGGHLNTFLGFWAGRLTKVKSGAERNMFIATEAGMKTELKSGANDNVFIAEKAGEQAVLESGASANTFMGYSVGYKAKVKGDRNMFMGNSAGQQGTIDGDSNDFVGYGAGYEAKVKGDANSFFGTFSGYKANVAAGADNNVFIGNHAGTTFHSGQTPSTKGSISGSSNIFVGHAAGRRATVSGGWNSFFGASGNLATVKGDGNTFIGNGAGNGANIKSTARGNVFIGDDAGEAQAVPPHTNIKGSISGILNTFVGHGEGRGATVSGDWNIFFNGAAQRAKVSGEGNFFAGNVAGQNATVTSDGNTFIGHNVMLNQTIPVPNNSAGDPHRSSTGHGMTYIGGEGVRIVAVGGNFRKCNTHGKNCKEVAVVNSSSKVYKKNIRPFEDFEKSLEDILKTPLWTYQFKDKGDHPDKKRIGLIAEELPKSLQLKEDPIAPDWPSVYGTLWAGIKALHKKIKGFVSTLSQISLELKKLKKEFKKQSAETKNRLTNQITKTQKQFKETNKRIKETNKELESANKQVEEANKQIEETNKKLKNANKRIKETNKELNKKLETTSKKLENTNKRLMEKNKHLESQLKETNNQLAKTNNQLKFVTKELAEKNKGLEKQMIEINKRFKKVESQFKD